ncbi:hypothetical protein NDU88_007480 [Pleurodeles waltl]|uniref:Uncharacterized protein n=1 Tax=Pleurodeles waltl TaxID=8319 RepID=A0AAV7VSN2_PLEWA|nr:hypothetical protein NDU88_007480 [Pleurodeles waltl]
MRREIAVKYMEVGAMFSHLPFLDYVHDKSGQRKPLKVYLNQSLLERKSPACNIVVQAVVVESPTAIVQAASLSQIVSGDDKKVLYLEACPKDDPSDLSSSLYQFSVMPDAHSSCGYATGTLLQAFPEVNSSYLALTTSSHFNLGSDPASQSVVCKCGTTTLPANLTEAVCHAGMSVHTAEPHLPKPKIVLTTKRPFSPPAVQRDQEPVGSIDLLSLLKCSQFDNTGYTQPRFVCTKTTDQALLDLLLSLLEEP